MTSCLARLIALVLTIASPLAAVADGEPAGAFDYYVLSLSWSPNWCARVGDARGSDQCDARHDHGWILHGLWPQYHRGRPAYCPTDHADPDADQTRAMADIMGTPGLAAYQWKKHGRCSGLPSAAYFALSRQAYADVIRPPVLRKLQDPVKLPAHVVEQAFLQDNPQLQADQITITCRDGHIHEARICLSRDLTPVPCGVDVIRDCTASDALLLPVR